MNCNLFTDKYTVNASETKNSLELDNNKRWISLVLFMVLLVGSVCVYGWCSCNVAVRIEIVVRKHQLIDKCRVVECIRFL